MKTSLATAPLTFFRSGFTFKVTSNDAEEMREQSAFWSYEHKQYNRGKFAGKITAFHTGRLQISWSSRSTGIFVRGGIPPGTTIITFNLTDPGKILYRGHPLQDSQVIALKHNEELEYHSLFPSTTLTIAVDTKLLNSRSLISNGGPFSSLRSQERLTMKPGYYNKQVDYLVSLLQSLYHSPHLHSAEDEELIENEILETILTGVQSSDPVSEITGRLHFAKQAEEYIRSNLKRSVTIQEICANVGTSERTLYLGFKERFGVSPKAYMQRMRLNEVFQELRTAKSKHMISRIAADWEFNHLGRFSKQYRRLFGESPSETLKKYEDTQPEALEQTQSDDKGR